MSGHSGIAATAAIVILCFLLQGSEAVYDPSLIVSNITSGTQHHILPLPIAGARALHDHPCHSCSGCAAGCPIPNVPYPPEQYQTDTLVTVFAPLAQQIKRQECVQQATSLAVCAFDGSLGIKSGCCSTECATQMAQVSNRPAMKRQHITSTALLANGS